MSEPEIATQVIQKSLEKMGENVKQKVDFQVIFFRWREFAGDFAKEIFPVDMYAKTLILYSSKSTLKDKFKYLAPELIKKINDTFNEEVIDKIIFGTKFNKPEYRNYKKKKIVESDETINELPTLTAEEIAECEKKSAVIENAERRQMLFNALVTKKKNEKFKKSSGWHKCILCENLCRAEDNLCEICQIYEERKLVTAIRRIFHDDPETKFRDVQKKILEEMPHMKFKCTLSFIESARMSLIQQTARRLSFGDKESPLAKFFVRLVRQIPEDALTEKIIEKTLYEFRFDFADRPLFPPQNFAKRKFSPKTVRKTITQQPSPPQIFNTSPVTKEEDSDAKK